MRKTEAAVGQVQGLFERHTEEVAQTTELVRRDVVALRKEIASALVKIEEGMRPIRDMQSQIQQVAEARKQDRDFVAGWLTRIEHAEQHLLTIQAQLKEHDERQRQLQLQIDRLREADAATVQETRKVSDELQIEKQSLRRQAVEAQQLVADVRNTIEDHAARIVRLDEIRKQIDLFAETLPRQYTELAAKFPDIINEIKRIERLSTERFLMNQERLEDLRQQADEKIGALQEAEDQHLTQLTSWLERIDSWLRELEQRLSRATQRLETVQNAQAGRIVELERRELSMLTDWLATIRDQVERTRAAQIEIRGGDEAA